jgi:hypothetical protein
MSSPDFRLVERREPTHLFSSGQGSADEESNLRPRPVYIQYNEDYFPPKSAVLGGARKSILAPTFSTIDLPHNRLSQYNCICPLHPRQ